MKMSSKVVDSSLQMEEDFGVVGVAEVPQEAEEAGEEEEALEEGRRSLWSHTDMKVLKLSLFQNFG